MLKDTNLITALTSKDVKMIVGIPHTRSKLTGTINKSNTKFTVDTDYYPIYPERGVSVAVEAADVTCETLKDTTYTEVTVSSVDLVADEETDTNVYGQVTLAAAPDPAAVDTVHLTYVEELKPYIAQSLKIDIKQDSSSYGELGEDVKHTTYGAQEITVTEDMLIGDMEPLRRLLFETYDGSETPETGYDVYQMIPESTDIYAYIPFEDADGEIGRLYLKGRIVPKNLLDVKDGDNASFQLELAIDDSPLMVVPEPA